MATKAAPLLGRRIVLTRAAGQAQGLARELSSLGAKIVFLPTVSFRAPEHSAMLDAAVAKLEGFDWILFTSQNAVRFFVERCRRLGRTRPPGIRVAAVGPSTAQAAEDAGWRCEHVAARFRGEALAEELADKVRGMRILLPRSDRASSALPNALTAAGADVESVVAYVNERAAASEEEIRVALAGADAVCFASPSALHNLFDLADDRVVRAALAGVAIAAIGPVTAEAIRTAGLEVAVEASEATAVGLARALAAYFVEAPSRKVAR
jgi:uroporphyrinogen-III synthase